MDISITVKKNIGLDIIYPVKAYHEVFSDPLKVQFPLPLGVLPHTLYKSYPQEIMIESYGTRVPAGNSRLIW